MVKLNGPWLVLGLAFLFVSSAGLHVTLTTLANGLAMQMERPHIYVGVYATTSDAGSALGPLLAYFAGTLITFSALYMAAGGVLLMAILQYWWSGGQKTRSMSKSNG